MNTLAPTLIYIAATGSAVFQSQVISLLHEIKKLNYFSNIILLAGYKTAEQKEAEMKKLSNAGLEIKFYRQYPIYSFYRNRQISEFKRKLQKVARANTVIHIRGEALTETVYQATQLLDPGIICNIVTDIRGAAFEEVKIYGSKINIVKHVVKLYNLKRNLKSAVQYSSYISCVTKALADYVQHKHPQHVLPIGVNHCVGGEGFNFNQEQRQIFREKMKLKESDILCVFLTGGNGPYQNTKYTIETFTSKGYKILNLSKIHVDHPQVINLFVNYQEVPGYLNASDIGVIWREENMVNKVASPVKFSEYVCCGLPVIANKGVQLINEYIDNTGFGTLINSYNEVTEEMITQLTKINRNEIASNAKQMFSAEVIAQNYLSIYKKITGHDKK